VVLLLFGCAIEAFKKFDRRDFLEGTKLASDSTPKTSTINILSSTSINDIFSEETSIPINTKALDRCNILVGSN